MSEAPSPPDLREVFERLAFEPPKVQRQLDAAYVDGLRRFAPIFADASRAGYEGLARSRAPVRQTVREYSAAVDVHFVQVV